jgi:hypothetical protein
MRLTDANTARGLITFVVVVSTVAMALMLVAYITISPDSDIENRFNYSKEILASLIVILGTIIGFYFGSAPNSTPAPGTASTPAPGTGTVLPLALRDLGINPITPEKGKTATLNATLSGSQPPYTYAISFTPNTIKEITGKSLDGKITQGISFDNYDPTMPLDIMLQATDNTGTTTGNRLHFDITQTSTQTP